MFRVKGRVQAAIRDGLINEQDRDWSELFAFNDPRDFAAYLRLVEAYQGKDKPRRSETRVLPLNRPMTAFNVTVYRLTARLRKPQGLSLSDDNWRAILADLGWLTGLARQLLLGRLDPQVDSDDDFSSLATWLLETEQRINAGIARAEASPDSGPIEVGPLALAVADVHTTVAEDPTPAVEVPAEPPGWEKLTAREREVVNLLASDFTFNEVAAKLGIAVPTVRTHIERVGAKLGVQARKVAVLRALRVL